MFDKVIDYVAPYGRRTEVTFLLLAYLAEQNAILVGDVGLAKSMTVRNLLKVLPDDFFSVSLNQYSSPDDLIGALDIKELQNGRRVRNVDGYLPTKSNGFIDEIYKARGETLGALLSILNERVIFEEGREIRCKTNFVVGTANKLIAPEETGALQDRFNLYIHTESLGDDIVGAYHELWVKPKDITKKLKSGKFLLVKEAKKEILKICGKKIIQDVLAIQKLACSYGAQRLSDRSIIKACELVATAQAMDDPNSTDISKEAYHALRFISRTGDHELWQQAIKMSVEASEAINAIKDRLSTRKMSELESIRSELVNCETIHSLVRNDLLSDLDIKYHRLLRN